MIRTIRIGMDTAAATGQKSGLGYYVENIAAKLSELQSEGRHKLEIIDRIHRDLRSPERLLWDQVGLPLTALTKGVDVLFVPAFSAPRFPKPIVMTAHDIYGVRYPDQFSGLAKRYWTEILPESMKRADHLISISEYTKQEIVSHLGIDESKITVIPNAASDDFRLLNDSDQVAAHIRRLGIEPPYIVSVGTIEPRKNLERLIDAFAFSKRGKHQLVIVGKKGWNYDRLFEKVRKYHLDGVVKFVDYIEQQDLVALYNGCTFFIMPSIYEGFGLPALEAMQCGAAVAVSQNSSLPEVVGDAGMVFDPFETDDIRHRMDRLFEDIDLRRHMQQLSVQRAKEFSWDRTARATLDVIVKVAQHGKRESA
jgi:glycosyltransferase involved in cell wall biosynthesis